MINYKGIQVLDKLEGNKFDKIVNYKFYNYKIFRQK